MDINYELVEMLPLRFNLYVHMQHVLLSLTLHNSPSFMLESNCGILDDDLLTG